MNKEELAQKTKKELVALAEEAGLAATLKMTKAELIDLVADAAPECPCEPDEDLTHKTKRELVAMAEEAGLSVTRKMSKAELLAMVASARQPAPVAEEPQEAEPAPELEVLVVEAEATCEAAEPATFEPTAEVVVEEVVWPRERVAIFAWESACGLVEGEVANDVAETASALARAGEDVHVFTRGVESGPTRMAGVTYHFCGTPAGADVLESADSFCAAAAAAFWRETAAGGPFLVAHGFEWLTAEAVRACREGGVPRTVMSFHSTEYQRAGGRFGDGISSRIRAVESAAAQSADRVVAASEEVKQQLQWVYMLPPDKLSVIYSGISAPPAPTAADKAAVKAAYGFRAEDPVFLYIGNLSDEMGPDLLLSSVPRILRADRYARFVFVGEGPLRDKLEEQARRGGLAEAVRFAGHLAGEPLQQLLSVAEAVVFPCRSAKPLATVLYAWSAAKPVIVTHTGPAEFVWHDVTGLKVYASEPSLVWGMERLLRDREFGAWLGQNARFAVDDAFTWDAVARKLCEVYHH
jgi:1,4-alpha-glucan branching enzyme